MKSIEINRPTEGSLTEAIKPSKLTGFIQDIGTLDQTQLPYNFRLDVKIFFHNLNSQGNKPWTNTG